MEKNRKKTSFLFPEKLDLVILLVVFLGFALKMNYLLIRVTGNYRLYVNIFRTANLALFMFGFGGLLISIRFGKLLLGVFSCIITLFFFAFVFHFRYFGTIASWTDLGRANTLAPVISSLFKQVAQPIDFLFLLDPFIITLVGVVSIIKKRKPRALRRVPYLAAIFLALFFQISQMIAFNIRYQKNFASLKLVGNSSFFNCHGATFYTFYDLYHHHKMVSKSKEIKPVLPDPPEFLKMRQYKIPAIFKNANVILLQVESLDSAILFRSHNGLEISPNINRIVRENVFCDRYFAQHNTGTVDADFSLITSNYAGEHYTAFTFCDLTKFTSLARSLKKYGYHTCAMHANRATFYNRNRAFTELGFDKFLSQKDYPPPPKGAWTLDDYQFLEISANRLAELKKPFFAYIITISTHTPFDFHPRKYDPPEFGDINSTLVKNYFSGIRFVDIAIARFLDILEQKGLLQNTIVVLLGDHTSKVNKQSYCAVDYIKEPIKDIGEYPEHVPLVFIYPEKQAEKIDKFCYPGDVPPTIMDLLGFHEDSTPWMGRSLFSKPSSPIINQGRKVFFNWNGDFYSGAPGNVVLWKKTVWSDPKSPPVPAEYAQYIFDLVKYSNDLLLKNYR